MMTFTILFTFPCEKSKTVSVASSLNKWIAVCLHRSRFAGKLICFIALGSTSSAWCLLKFIAIKIK